MWIECHTEKRHKIVENARIKNCNLSDCEIGLRVGKGCNLITSTDLNIFTRGGINEIYRIRLGRT